MELAECQLALMVVDFACRTVKLNNNPNPNRSAPNQYLGMNLSGHYCVTDQNVKRVAGHSVEGLQVHR